SAPANAAPAHRRGEPQPRGATATPLPGSAPGRRPPMPTPPTTVGPAPEPEPERRPQPQPQARGRSGMERGQSRGTERTQAGSRSNAPAAYDAGSPGRQGRSAQPGAGRGAAAAPAAQASGRPRMAFDDLDEDTRVLQGMHPPADEVDRAFQSLLGGAEPAAQAMPAAASVAMQAAASSLMDELTDAGTSVAITAPDAHGMQGDGATSPQIAIPRLTTLPALRVAVMSAGVPGDVRIMPLDGTAGPPPGAAVALLVPVTLADGDEIAKLFGSFV